MGKMEERRVSLFFMNILIGRIKVAPSLLIFLGDIRLRFHKQQLSVWRGESGDKTSIPLRLPSSSQPSLFPILQSWMRYHYILPSQLIILTRGTSKTAWNFGCTVRPDFLPSVNYLMESVKLTHHFCLRRIIRKILINGFLNLKLNSPYQLVEKVQWTAWTYSR